LSGGIDYHTYGVGVLRLYVTNVTDKAGVVRIITWTSDGYDVAGGTHLGSGPKSYGNIAAASGIRERSITDGRIEVAGAV
jgi:hypothetical protein